MMFSDADIRDADQVIMLDAMQEEEAYPTDADETVSPDNACPGCGENRVDWLVWAEDGTQVDCATCGASYDPSEV